MLCHYYLLQLYLKQSTTALNYMAKLTRNYTCINTHMKATRITNYTYFTIPNRYKFRGKHYLVFNNHQSKRFQQSIPNNNRKPTYNINMKQKTKTVPFSSLFSSYYFSTNASKEDINGQETKRKTIFKRFWAPRIHAIHEWDAYDWIFSVAHIIQLCGFLSYDVWVLRGLSLAASFSLMMVHAHRGFFVGWLWTFSFVIANAFAIMYLLREKYSTLALSTLSCEELYVYENFFHPYSLTPVQYKSIVENGTFENIKKGEYLTNYGLEVDKVYLLLSGECAVFNHAGNVIDSFCGGTMKSFVGEISLIDDTQDVAIASVQTNSEICRVLWWKTKYLKDLLSTEKADFRVKLINVFTGSMKAKIIDLNKSIHARNIQHLENMIEIISLCGIPMNEKQERIIDEYLKVNEISGDLLQTLYERHPFQHPIIVQPSESISNSNPESERNAT